jgi:hypothetical protein
MPAACLPCAADCMLGGGECIGGYCFGEE